MSQSLLNFSTTTTSTFHKLPFSTTTTTSTRRLFTSRKLKILSLSIKSSTSPLDATSSPNGTTTTPSSSAATTIASAAAAFVPSIEVDSVTETELKENGFRSTRRTKLVCTIGPVTCGSEQLEALAVGGMNVARINMCHGTREWHRRVIERVRKLNEEKGFAVAIMMDTEGSEIHMGDLGGAPSAKAEVLLFLVSLHFIREAIRSKRNNFPFIPC